MKHVLCLTAIRSWLSFSRFVIVMNKLLTQMLQCEYITGSRATIWNMLQYKWSVLKWQHIQEEHNESLRKGNELGHFYDMLKFGLCVIFIKLDFFLFWFFEVTLKYSVNILNRADHIWDYTLLRNAIGAGSSLFCYAFFLILHKMLPLILLYS